MKGLVRVLCIIALFCSNIEKPQAQSPIYAGIHRIRISQIEKDENDYYKGVALVRLSGSSTWTEGVPFDSIKLNRGVYWTIQSGSISHTTENRRKLAFTPNKSYVTEAYTELDTYVFNSSGLSVYAYFYFHMPFESDFVYEKYKKANFNSYAIVTTMTNASTDTLLVNDNTRILIDPKEFIISINGKALYMEYEGAIEFIDKNFPIADFQLPTIEAENFAADFYTDTRTHSFDLDGNIDGEMKIRQYTFDESGEKFVSGYDSSARGIYLEDYDFSLSKNPLAGIELENELVFGQGDTLAIIGGKASPEYHRQIDEMGSLFGIETHYDSVDFVVEEGGLSLNLHGTFSYPIEEGEVRVVVSVNEQGRFEINLSEDDFRFPYISDTSSRAHDGLLVSWYDTVATTNYIVEFSTDSFKTIDRTFETANKNTAIYGLEPETSYQVRVNRNNESNSKAFDFKTKAKPLGTLTSDEAIIYPNPTNGEINLSIQDQEVSAFKLFDPTGKVILKSDSKMTSSHLESRLSNYFSDSSNGTYLIIVDLGDKRFQNRIIRK